MTDDLITLCRSVNIWHEPDKWVSRVLLALREHDRRRGVVTCPV